MHVALFAALLGLVVTALALVIEPERTLVGYLAAYVTASSVAMGALVLLLIGYATNARWLAAVRRKQETIVIVFPLLAVLFLPIAFGVHYIYGWAQEPAIARTRPWFDPAGFIIRSYVYLAVFIIAAEVLRRSSRRRDVSPPAGDPEVALRRDRRFAGAMLPPVALALTFASVDWVMTLMPDWVSSMFPVYFFAGGFSAGIAMLAILADRWHVELGLTGHHFHALGRLMFAFVVFWAYTAYFQGFLIQIANRPTEVAFYVDRLGNPWRFVLVGTVFFRFALPFLLLLPRSLKFRPRYVADVALVLLLGHVLDIYWIVIPSAHLGPSWVGLVALVGITGACVAFCAWRCIGVPEVATGDPFLPAALRYQSPT
jgi:hypothetical protein